MNAGHKMKTVSMWFLKIVVLVVALSVPVAAVYDLVRPWPEAAELLQRYPGGIRICIGLGFRSSGGTSPGQSALIDQHTRAFVMLPSVLWLPNVFTVQRGGSQGIQVGHSLGDFFTFCVIYGCSLAGTWWLLVRRTTG